MTNKRKNNTVESKNVTAKNLRGLLHTLFSHDLCSFLNPRFLLGIIVLKNIALKNIVLKNLDLKTLLQNKFINTASTFFVLTLLVLSPVEFSFAAEQESLSPASKPIEGRKPEYETGEVLPSLDGNLPLPNNASFTEDDTFGDLQLILETPSASDSDGDESPSLRLEPSVDNLTNTPKPLMQWFLLDKNDPVNGPKTPVSIQETLNSVRMVDVAPGRTLELQINASLIPFTLTGFPRDGDGALQEKRYQFIVPKRTPSVMSDNFYNPINSPFPTIGFKNGSFNIITPLLAKEYNWEIDSTSRDLVTVDGSKSIGVVKLIKQPDIDPDAYHPITITATPKDGVTAENPIISHTFTLTRWLIYGPEVLAGKPMPVEFDVGLEACRTLGNLYGIPRASFFVQSSNDGTERSRSLTGNLWNEWGDISKVSQEPWVLTGKTGLEGYYHTSDQTPEGNKITAQLGNGLSKEVLFTELLNLACAVNLDGSPLNGPQLRNFNLTGELLVGNTPIVSYNFDPATVYEDDPELEDRSRYSWGYKGKTTTGEGSRKTLVTTGSDILAQGAVADVQAVELQGSGITEFKLPALTENEIGKVLEISVQPININDMTGPIQTISTDMPGAAGNHTYTRFMRVDGSKTQVFEVDNSGVISQNINFPTTGFKGAFFTLGLETGLTARDFDWQVKQGNELVSVDQDGVVELLKMPQDHQQEIIIEGVSKPTIYRPVSTYDTKRPASAPITYQYKFTLKQWYFGNPGGTPLTRDQADNLCYAANREFGVDNFAIPSFKYQLFEAATADNNKDTSFIKFNGMLWNEWGDLRAFAKSDFKSQYFWVAEIGDANNRKLNKRISWDATNLQATAANTNDQNGNLSAQTQLICGRNLDGTDFYGVPKLKDFRLSGGIAEGSKLTVSYYFAANNQGAPLNGAVITPANYTTIDLSTYSSSYEGQNTPELALLTNDRITAKLTPVTVIFEPTKNMYRAEFVLGPLPAGSQNNIISISVRPIIQGDLSGMIRTIDSTMQPEDGNFTYRGFSSVEPTVNTYTFYGKELESDDNFPTTGFKGAKFRLNTSAKAGESVTTNALYNWSVHFDALEASEGVDASEYFQIGQTGADAGVLTMVKRPPMNRRTYVTAINKTNVVDKLAYGFKLQKWYDPNLNNFDAFYSISTPLNPTEFVVNQPKDTQAENADFSNVFPTTGFPGAKFKLNIGVAGALNNQFNWWTSEDEKPFDDRAAKVNAAGEVVLLKQPEFNSTITIFAQFKDESRPPMEYTFKLQKWFNPMLGSDFYSIQTPLSPYEFLPVMQPTKKNPDDFTGVFPSTGFPGALFRLNLGGTNGRDNLLYNWSSSHPELASVGNGPIDNTPNGAGNVVLLEDPEVATEITISATPRPEVNQSTRVLNYRFKVTKWFNQNLPNINVDFYSAETFLSDAEYPVIQPKDKTNPNADFSKTFPTTGFPGAIFRLNTGMKGGRDNALYTWESSHPDLVSVGNNGVVGTTPENAGNVTLLKDPDVATPVTITATPIEGASENTKVLTYTFKVTKWFHPDLPLNGSFYSAQTFLSDYEHFIAQPKDAPNPDADYSNTFPTTGFPGAIFRLNIGGKDGLLNANYDWVSSHPELATVGNGPKSNTSDGAGNVTLVTDPERATAITITATPKAGATPTNPVLTYTFKVVKWFNQNLPPANANFYSAETFLSDAEYPVIQPKNAETDAAADFSKTFPTTGFPGAIFRLNIGSKGGQFNADYNWSTSEDSKPESERLIKVGNSGTVNSTETGSGNVTLIRDPDVATPVTVIAVPKGGATSTNPELRYTFKITKWFHPDLPPQSANSNFYSAGTFLTNYEHPIVQPEDVNAPDADFSKTFPTTGFPGAVFRLNIGDGKGRDNALYNWTLANPAHSQYVKLGNNGTVGTGADNAGNVTLIEDPERATVITVVATPIPEKTSDTRVLTYSFKVVKWFNQDLKPFESFNSITVADGQKIAIGESKAGDYSKVFPQTGFKNAKFRLNVGDDTAVKNTQYNWRSSDATVASVNASGEVTLLKRPTTSGFITITAEPKDTSSGDASLNYTFKLAKWFDANLTPPTGRFSVITLPLDEETVQLPVNTPDGTDFSGVFPQTGFTNAMFRLNIGNTDAVPSKNDSYNWSVTASEAGIVKVGNTVNLDKRNVESAGNVTLLKRPSAPVVVTITATNKTNAADKLTYQFKLAKWFEMDLEDFVTKFASITTISDQAIIAVEQPDGDDFSAVFPQTGFTNARFRLDIMDSRMTILNQDYNWSVNPEAATYVSVGNANFDESATGAGNVTLLARPNSPMIVTVTATPKAGVTAKRPVLTYRFKLAKWFETQTQPIISQFTGISLPLDADGARFTVNGPVNGSFADVFPRTGFKGAMFRLEIANPTNPQQILNAEYDWRVEGDTNSDLVSVGNAAMSNTATGAGNVTLLKRPASPTEITIVATPKVANPYRKVLRYTFKLEKWFETQLTANYTKQFHSISLPYGNSADGAAGTPMKTLPIIVAKEFDFSGVFPRTGFNNAAFRLNIGTPDALLNDQYNWTWIEDGDTEIVYVGNTATGTAITKETAGLITLLKRPAGPTVVTVKATPKSGVGDVLTYRFRLAKWFAADLLKPVERIEFISLKYGNSAGSLVIGEPLMFAPNEPVDGDYSLVFPRTGFKNAQFRLNIERSGQLNTSYTWSVNRPDLVKVGNSPVVDDTADSAGTVTLLKKPDAPTEIVITATPPTITGSTPVLSYRFKLAKWFDPNLEKPLLRFNSATSPFDGELELEPIALVKPNAGDFTKTYPRTGFNGAMFRLNIGDPTAPLNNQYNWSSSEDTKPSDERLVSVGNGPLDTTANGAGNVKLLKRPATPTEITITARVKPEFVGTRPELRPELTYTFKTERWFSPDMPPQRITKAFSSITAGGATSQIGSTDYLRNAVNDDFENVFPMFGGAGLTFSLGVAGYNALDFDWSSSEPELATVSETGVVSLGNEPEKQTVVTITAKPKNNTDKSVYVYRFRISKWTRFSTGNMSGYFQAAPNSRWPEDIWNGELTEWPWPASNGGIDKTEVIATNPDLYCESVGNGYRSMTATEYSANYPTARPFNLSAGVTQSRLRTGSYSHEWGNAMQQSVGSATALWLAEPLGPNIRLSTRANTQLVVTTGNISSSLLKAACVRELPLN